jgi:hypothetical protein
MTTATARLMTGRPGTIAPSNDPVPFPPVDPTKNQIILCVGRKGSGKSQWAREAFRHWPGVDRLVIDPSGDADPGSPRRPGQPASFRDDLNTQLLTTLPSPPQMPARQRVNGQEVPGVYRWIVNPLSPTVKEDRDRAVALGLFPKDRRSLLWLDEATKILPAGATGPYGNLALEQSRHYHCSLLICCPRPLKIDPLCLSQADRVIMFDVPGTSDRQRLSETLGWPHGNLVALLDEVRKLPFHYLMYMADEHRMYICPPIPMT